VTASGALRRAEAAAIAESVLRDEPRWWRHCQGVAVRALELARIVPPSERDLLISAAWLHDIGYAARLQQTGFHPLDGALYLEQLGQPVLAALVAHHSGARFVAVERGLSDELARFSFRQDVLTDALTSCDQSVDHEGQPTNVHDRMRDMLARHGVASANARAHPLRAVYLLAAVSRTEQRLSDAGQGDELRSAQ
jgi:predicted HD phosphohydrolase